ncbi:MAG: hypothetical protein L3J14_04855 [Flavobacteriaceae bacterium]|nr:hypothetical protein [Flavobacteriaceae bacterium]
MKNILFTSIIIILTSCSQKKSNTNDLDKPFVQLNKEVVLGNYKGKIGTNLDVLFHLDNNNGNVSGFYFYKKNGIDINVVGNVKGDSLIAYELDFKKDTLAILKGNISESSINGKWINAKSKKEYPLIIEKTSIAISPLPTNLEGRYYNSNCDLTLSFFKSKGEYYYNYKSNDRSLKGKVSFSRGDNLYINLENIEYAEDYFDVSLPEEDIEKSKKYKELKKIGKRKIGIECQYNSEEIIIQNYGNSMNYYVKLYDCGEKYIHFKKQ